MMGSGRFLYRIFTLMFFVCLNGSLIVHGLYNGVRTSSYPYISGDTFRGQADFVFDDDSSFEPQAVVKPSVIFVPFESLEDFFKLKHPFIDFPYVLVSHNSDCEVPGPYSNYLEDPKIIHWFGTNPSIRDHPKFTALPIGIANKFWPHGNTLFFDFMISRLEQGERKYLAYSNFSKVNTLPDDTYIPYQKARNEAWEYFKDKSFAFVAHSFLPLIDYLTHVSQSSFVISPRGHGLDCHRTWEALMMGAYPILQTSTLDAMFKDLPVMIINDWQEVTEESLTLLRDQFSRTPFMKEKLFAPYWIEKIREKCNSITASENALQGDETATIVL